MRDRGRLGLETSIIHADNGGGGGGGERIVHASRGRRGRSCCGSCGGRVIGRAGVVSIAAKVTRVHRLVGLELELELLRVLEQVLGVVLV